MLRESSLGKETYFSGQVVRFAKKSKKIVLSMKFNQHLIQIDNASCNQIPKKIQTTTTTTEKFSRMCARGREKERNFSVPRKNLLLLHPPLPFLPFFPFGRSRGKQKKSAKKISHLSFFSFQKIDVDGGGAIDFNEFLELMEEKMRKLKQDEQIFEAFRVFDRDRNGYITGTYSNKDRNTTKKNYYFLFSLILGQEIRFALVNLGYDVSVEETERVVREADQDGDGFINYEEFYLHLISDGKE